MLSGNYKCLPHSQWLLCASHGQQLRCDLTKLSATQNTSLVSKNLAVFY